VLRSNQRNAYASADASSLVAALERRTVRIARLRRPTPEPAAGKYISDRGLDATTMLDRVTRLGLLAFYQSTLVVGILALPFALLAARLGVTLPVGRLVEEATEAYEAAA